MEIQKKSQESLQKKNTKCETLSDKASVLIKYITDTWIVKQTNVREYSQKERTKYKYSFSI